jgi:hypothetical protein
MIMDGTGQVGFGIAPATNAHFYENAASIVPQVRIEQDHANGDAALNYLLTGGQNWSTGIDTDLGDAFVVAAGADLSTNPWFTISPAGVTLIGDIDGTDYVEIEEDGDTVFVGGAGLVFGSCWGNEIGWTQINAVQNTWYDISDADMDDGQLHNVTHDGSGQLTVLEPGMYRAAWTIATEVSTALKHIQITFSVNGAATNDGMNHIEPPSANRQQAAAGVAILDLADNDTVEVAIRTTDAGTPNLSVDHLNITLTQIGGT